MTVHDDPPATRVLVIEDESLIAMDIENELVDSGYEVVGPAGNVDEAERLARSEKYQAVVLDMNLRGRDVRSVLSVLAKKRVPFLVVSGYSSPALPKDVVPTRRLQKPVDSRRIVEAVRGMLNRSGGQDAGGPKGRNRPNGKS
jgi:DNA-binding response OmpR family regulator